MHQLLFLSSTSLGVSLTAKAPRSPAICTRLCPSANINFTSDPSREDEIAAKIAALRKYKRGKEQKASEEASKSLSDNATGGTDMSTTDISASSAELGGEQAGLKDMERVGESTEDNSLFSQLPDWKKEEILQRQMMEAESFFNSNSDATTKTANPEKNGLSKEDPDPYKPKVSTWGVFPRPDNISKTYGGGRRIARGGQEVNTEKQRERDAKIAKRLAAYMESRGIDVAKEEEHREEIETALMKADEFMRKSFTLKAATELEHVKPLISENSRLGGQVLLSLALAYDTLGRRDDAREMYQRLKGNPFDDIASKARQLLQGFSDMEMLRIDDDAARGGDNGPRVMNFRLPDMNYATDRRYETVVAPSTSSERSSTSISPPMSAALAMIMLGPLLIVVLLALTRSQH